MKKMETITTNISETTVVMMEEIQWLLQVRWEQDRSDGVGIRDFSDIEPSLASPPPS